MSRKAIFFDIDGTLLSSKNERHFFVQPSTWKALEQLKRAHCRHFFWKAGAVYS